MAFRASAPICIVHAGHPTGPAITVTGAIRAPLASPPNELDVLPRNERVLTSTGNLIRGREVRCSTATGLKRAAQARSCHPVPPCSTIPAGATSRTYRRRLAEDALVNVRRLRHLIGR